MSAWNSIQPQQAQAALAPKKEEPTAMDVIKEFQKKRMGLPCDEKLIEKYRQKSKWAK